jgi:hypothetical protein
MSAPALEGGEDDDDMLGFPGDGFVDKTDVNPGVNRMRKVRTHEATRVVPRSARKVMWWRRMDM